MSPEGLSTVSYHLPGSDEVWGLLAIEYRMQKIKPLNYSPEFAFQQWSPSKLTEFSWLLLFQILFGVWDRLQEASTFG